ncbi:DUF6161 domain-containing protein [Thalassotalea marina]|uniref:DUF6161 domain-containing protein n=1 Tax=Thalassotalea marina TaxID=1673741 RepID=A0A919BLI9_9GAMM|nr:DUF6161 domain-containing protein [Thalassotalea marina]GHF97419.1 hypothetical protein GCM10017161_26990 [Thalassotalea marina]
MSEEIEQEEAKLKRITIKTETGSKWFDDPEKLLAWVQQQRQSYGFHSNVSQRYQMQQLFSTFDGSWNNLQKQITQGLQRFKNDPDIYNTRVEQFSQEFANLLKHKQLFTDEAPFYDFIQRQASKSNEFGLAAIAVVFDVNVAQIDRKMYQGLQEADAYISGNEDRVRDEADSLQMLKERWDIEFEEQRNKLTSDFNIELVELIEHKVNADKLIKKWDDQTEAQSVDLETHKEQFKSAFDDELLSSKKDLENLTKTYDDKLALHAAVKYWGIQKDNNRNKAIGFGVVMIVMIIAVVTTLMIFVDSHLNTTIKDVALNKLITVAAITTFGIWLIKVAANIFMSHLHLATDAQERRTMIHTYLALTRKGQGPKEEDRQLILQTLFRPSTTDMVKNDQGPTQLVDLINRLSPKQ